MKAQIFDQVRNRVGTFAEVFWKEVVVAATQLANHKAVGAAVDDYNRCKAVSAAINRLVRNAANDCLSGLEAAGAACGAQTARAASSPAACSFDQVAVGPHDARLARRLRIPP